MAATTTMRKITISLPAELVAFVDQRAAEAQTNRSYIISQMLAGMKNDIEIQVAGQGYQFYAEESSKFAQASAGAIAESWAAENWAELL